ALRASMMGGWFLSTAIGLKVSGVFGEVYARAATQQDHKTLHITFWIVLIVINVAAALLVFVLLPWLNRQMGPENYSRTKEASGAVEDMRELKTVSLRGRLSTHA